MKIRKKLNSSYLWWAVTVIAACGSAFMFGHTGNNYWAVLISLSILFMPSPSLRKPQQ